MLQILCSSVRVKGSCQVFKKFGSGGVGQAPTRFFVHYFLCVFFVHVSKLDKGLLSWVLPIQFFFVFLYLLTQQDP